MDRIRFWTSEYYIRRTAYRGRLLNWRPADNRDTLWGFVISLMVRYNLMHTAASHTKALVDRGHAEYPRTEGWEKYSTRSSARLLVLPMTSPARIIRCQTVPIPIHSARLEWPNIFDWIDVTTTSPKPIHHLRTLRRSFLHIRSNWRKLANSQKQPVGQVQMNCRNRRNFRLATIYPKVTFAGFQATYK